MIEEQLTARGIRDQAVLQAMHKVPRELFIPQELIEFAYDDSPLPIGYQQTISQPYMVAFMSEILQLDKNSKVLEIGTGSGYQAAILAELGGDVYTLEIIKPLGQQAKKLLYELGYHNVHFKIGDGYEGWAEKAPFDAIIVTCAPSHIPQKLKDQLKEDGRMILPVGEKNQQILYLLEKKNDMIVEKSVFPVKFVPMTNTKGSIY
ncbi:MAG: protein-L-isoaspartate(D-aspartate) O-methyltransferase [Microscillaceae bacterium]|nr:protein-L-isoaspartate(D-aspartate) O-methyltransferase [Microscillaceae bacterium]